VRALKTVDRKQSGSGVDRPRCVLCGAVRCKLFLTIDEYQLFRCRECQLVFVYPQPPKSKLEQLRADLYGSNGYREMYFSSSDRLRRRFGRCLKEIAKYKTNGKLLDVGCSYGFFLEMAAGTWEAYGVESCEESADYARQQLGLNVSAGTLDSAKLPDRFFDVITMWDVLEHQSSVKGMMQEVARILKDGGLLFIQCPNIDSLMAKLTRYKGWGWLCVPDHLVHFSPQSLIDLLQRSDLEVMRIRTWEPLSEFLDNVLPSPNLGGRFRAGSKLSHLSFLSNMVARKALLSLLTPIAWPLQRLWCSLGQGGLIQVYAVKA